MRKSQFSKALTIALSPEQYEQIKEITDQGHISMGKWVRGAIDAAFERHQRQIKEEVS